MISFGEFCVIDIFFEYIDMLVYKILPRWEEKMLEKRRIKSILYLFFPLILMATFCYPCDSQENEKNPSALEEYDFIVRGRMSRDRGIRPDQVALMDSNGEILIACAEAATAEQLKSAGIHFLQSQLELLVDWNLLEFENKGKTYRTTVHVYGKEKATAMRRHVQQAANELSVILKEDLVALKSYLDGINRENNLFAVLYAYILHSYSMDQFGEVIYQKPQLSEKKPFWNGFAWAIYPIRKFDIGVLNLPVDGSRFFIISPKTMPRPDFRQLLAFVKDAADDNKVDDPDLKKSLAPFNIFNEEGALTIPVFSEDWSANLENMAKKVYAKTAELADSEEIKNILMMENSARTAMFVHYELRYAFLKSLLEQGVLREPVDLTDASNNSAAEMRSLIFLMKSGKK